MATLAYTLMILLRRLGLKGTELAQACATTIRTKMFKIGVANRAQRPVVYACCWHWRTR